MIPPQSGDLKGPGMRGRMAKAPAEAQQRRARLAVGAAAALAALIAMPGPADAARRHARHHAERAADAVAPRPDGPPIMAIVSIKSQRVTIYDADGWILPPPVSTGPTPPHTP